MQSSFDIAIVGSGPSGLSAAARAAQCGLSHVLLESKKHLADTIFKYQKGKYVMAEPAVLPLRSPLSFEAGTRETILQTWETQAQAEKVNVKFESEVASIAGQKGAFLINLTNGETIQCKHVVLAIGMQGNLRKLGVSGDDLPTVQYQLDDPSEYSGETILVVGAGDAAIENAVALSKQNSVIVINRGDDFKRAKEANEALILDCIKQKKIECWYGSALKQIVNNSIEGEPVLTVDASTATGPKTVQCDRIIARLGAIAPRGLVESFGIVFPSRDPNCVPQLSATYESNVPGIYIVGALAGYPLIKQAMNQGYEVIETIAGRDVAPADEPVLQQKLASIFSAGLGVQSVTEALAFIQSRVPWLGTLSTLQLREFLLDSTIHVPAERSIVFERNDYTNSLYSILNGTVEVQLPRGGVATITMGRFFGEIGLVSGRRRSATISAGKNCVLIESPRRSVNKLLASVAGARSAIDAVFLKRAVQTFIADDLPNEAIDVMTDGATLKIFSGGETVFSEGDEADGLYLIRRGAVTVSRGIGPRQVTMSYVASGNFVGEMALVNDSRRSATIVTSTTTEMIVLDAKRFKHALAQFPQLRERIQKTILERIRINAESETKTDEGGLVGFLMRQGIGEATDVLLIDESLCIRCDNCEKACADTHRGTSRLDREAGPTFANVHVPTSCRHCEHPHCMKDCPPDAIRRSPNGEVFIEDSCIGCGNCVRNCPYGVIHLAPRNDNYRSPSLWKWLIASSAPEPGVDRGHAGEQKVKVAVKCDMCKDQKGGPACVRSCPTGAALRVSPQRFLEYIKT